MTAQLAEPAPASVGRPAAGEGRAKPARPSRPNQAGWRKGVEIAAFTGPALIVFLTFVIAPVIFAAYCGFFNWNGNKMPTKFIGFDNYLDILANPLFREALAHNGFIVVMSLVVQGPLALLVALLLNQKMRGRSVLRVLLFVPYVISEVIAAVGWNLMLQFNGTINDVLLSLHIVSNPMDVPDWLSDPNIAIWVVLGLVTWKYLGFAIILFLAGMQSIPEELAEAAAVDGASYWKTQFHVTLPLLGPTIRIWAFLSIIGSLQLFDIVYILWGKIAEIAGTSTMATFMVQHGRDDQAFGYGNAVAVVLFLISLVIALTYQRFVLRRDTEGALTERR